MRKLSSLLLSLAVFIVFSIPVQAQQNAGMDGIHASGLFVTIDTFNNLYGKPNSSDDALINLKENAKMILENIFIHNDEVSFIANVSYNDQNKMMNASGKLYKGYKQANSINSFVGDLTDRNGNFSVLLFEIYNDRAKDKTLIDKKLRNSPHVKIYLSDNQNNLIIFELPLPPEFESVSIDNNDKIDTTKDFFWFANVIKPYEQLEIPTTEEMKVKLGATNPDGISPSAVGYFSDWAGDTTYYTALYVGIDYVQAWSLPYGSWKALDVKNQSTWTNSFKIAEHVDVNGKTMRSVDNPFKYRNVRLTTAVGAKSTIVNAMTDGRLQGKSSGSSLAMKIIEKAWSTALPAAPSISEITGWVNAIIDAGTDKTITLGS